MNSSLRSLLRNPAPSNRSRLATWVGEVVESRSQAYRAQAIIPWFCDEEGEEKGVQMTKERSKSRMEDFTSDTK